MEPQDIQETVKQHDGVWLSIVAVIAVTLGGWALLQVTSIDSRVHAMEAVLPVESKEIERRLLSIETKLDELGKRVK